MILDYCPLIICGFLKITSLDFFGQLNKVKFPN